MNNRESFVYTHPEVFERWHPTLNDGLDPSDYTYGSNQKVWWYWEECGHSHARMIKHQINNGKCYDCSVKESATEVGANKKAKSLQTLGFFAEHYPELSKDWSHKNDKTAHEVHRNSSEEIIWECHVCKHEWQTQVRYRARGTSNCGVCSDRILHVGLNDLASRSPELAIEWHPNNSKASSEVRYKDQYVALWECSKCSHKWTISVNQRAKGAGCPECYRSSKVSKGQQEVADFIESTGHKTVMNAMGFDNSRSELDIYIPSLNLAVEYNGDYWHSDSVTLQRWGKTAKEMNEAKLKLCHSHGIELLFIWESDWIEKRGEVEEAMVVVLAGQAMSIPSLFVRTESSIRLANRPLIQRSNKGLRARALTDEEKTILRDRYMAGESAAALSQDLAVSKLYVFQFVDNEDLASKREKLGISKNGATCVPESLFEGFAEDWVKLKQYDLLKKYGVSYKMAKKTAVKLGLVSA